MLLGLVVAVLLVVVGSSLLIASHHMEGTGTHAAADPTAEPSRSQRIAAFVHDGVDRTAQAVDVLVDRRPADEVLRREDVDPHERRTGLLVIGGGLVGLGAVALLGALLIGLG